MSQEFGKVGVLYGGISGEREVSLMSGQGIYEALKSKGIDAHLFDLGKCDLVELAQSKFDRVFIALHGKYGEDGAIQGVLEWLGIPYTGCGVMASAIAMDKIMTKKIWLHAGISTPSFQVVSSLKELEEAVDLLGVPMILKAASEGSTLGLVKILSKDQIGSAYQAVKPFGDVLLAEQFISGRELTVPVFGKGAQAKALPIIEIMAPQGNYDFQNKYYSDKTRYECPAKIDENLNQKIMHMCEQAYRAVEAEGWARIDIMLDENEQPWLLEINTSPGMTSHSLVPMSAKAIGLSYADLCVRLLATASCKIKSNSH